MTSTMQHQKAGKTLITLWYAKHRNIPVEGIEVAVERGASQGRAGIYRLSTKLTVTGALSAAQPDDLPRAAQNNQSYGHFCLEARQRRNTLDRGDFPHP